MPSLPPSHKLLTDMKPCPMSSSLAEITHSTNSCLCHLFTAVYVCLVQCFSGLYCTISCSVKAGVLGWLCWLNSVPTTFWSCRASVLVLWSWPGWIWVLSHWANITQGWSVWVDYSLTRPVIRVFLRSTNSLWRRPRIWYLPATSQMGERLCL